MKKGAAKILIILAIVVIVGLIAVAIILDNILSKHELILDGQQIILGKTTAGELIEKGYDIYSFDKIEANYQEHLDSDDYYKINLKRYEPIDVDNFDVEIKSDSRVSERSPYIIANNGRYYGSIGFYYGDKSKEMPIKEAKITNYKFYTDVQKEKWPNITIYLSKHRFKNRASLWHSEKLTDVTVDMMEQKYKRSSIKEDYYLYCISRKISIPLSGSFMVDIEFSKDDLNKVIAYEINLFDK